MSWLDWLIVLVPVAFVMYMGYRSRSYVRGVADFLSAGRICGRYVISVADVANGLSIITLVAFVEVHYKTGFAMTFWNNVILPLSLVLSLTGYCVYRFRETKAMSLGQFLEIRYNRPLRIFAAALRSLSEMLANMICPAVAARFFIYFLDLPHHFTSGDGNPDIHGCGVYRADARYYDHLHGRDTGAGHYGYDPGTSVLSDAGGVYGFCPGHVLLD